MKAVSAAAIVYVSRLPAMRRFYAECFGLAATESSDEYCVLESGDWSVSLVLVPAAVAATIELSAPAVARAGTPIKLAFEVADIEALRPLIAKLGGQLNPAETTWAFQDRRRCDCLDPEGNVVQLLAPLG
jgi:predicted enzyme related to lactoylglutathione lyase